LLNNISSIAGEDNEVARFVENNLNFAKDHIEILTKYGRYPHRNEILGRQSTIEEEEYLE
jgi:uncharacterized protein (DUF924 family)